MDVDAMRREYVAYWSCYAHGGERTDEDGVSILHTGLPAPGLNAVLAIAPEDPDDAARAFAARCRRLRVPYSWSVWPDEPSRDVGDLQLWNTLTLMRRPAGAPTAVRSDAAFEELPPERLDEWCGLLVRAFGLPASAIRTAHAMHSRGLESPHLRYAWGLVDDAPVVAGILHTGAAFAGVYAVAVDPDKRRRGHGAAMTEHLAASAPDAAAVLQATPPAVPLYKKLGFRPLGTLNQYAWRPRAK